MAEHPIQGLMGVTIEKIRDMVNSETIIGDPIHVDDTTIIPVSRVTFGFASGGSDVGPSSNKQMFGGGSGAGVSVTPVAFLVVSNGNVYIVRVYAPEFYNIVMNTSYRSVCFIIRVENENSISAVMLEFSHFGKAYAPYDLFAFKRVTSEQEFEKYDSKRIFVSLNIRLCNTSYYFWSHVSRFSADTEVIEIGRAHV